MNGKTALEFRTELALDQRSYVVDASIGDAVAALVDILVGYSLDLVGDSCDVAALVGNAVSVLGTNVAHHLSGVSVYRCSNCGSSDSLRLIDIGL